MKAQAGVTLLETAVALLLTLLLSVLLTGLAARLRVDGETMTRRMEVVEARRVTRDLLSETLAGASLPPAAGVGLRARFWVGWATRCREGGSWRYQGRRNPDPERDSIWMVNSDGEVRVAALTARTTGACGSETGGGDAVELEASSSLDDAVLARFFESGRFTVSDALRYGRIGTRPQPLTAAVLDEAASALVTSVDGVAVRLAAPGDTLGVRGRWRQP